MTIHFLKKSYFPKTFWVLVFLKLLSGLLFASHYVTEGFLPFFHYFLTTGKNPYDYFYLDANVVFPYPAGMFFVVGTFLGLGKLLIDNIFSNIHITLLIFRLPILVADIAIYLSLCKLLPSKENKVLLLYFASPILFYINYYHGQLDVIPTAFLITSLYFLSVKRYLVSYVILGLGIATKTHLIIVLPFYAIYLLRHKWNLRKIIAATFLSILTFGITNIPFLTKSYIFTVFNNIEQQRLFLVVFPYHYKELSLLIAPAALLLCLYAFASTKRLNFDSLILTLGLAFTVLIALVPPMQGWFYWSIPLFTFFLIKYKDSRLLSFFMMNIFFMAFFIFTKDSDIFESASVTFSALSQLPNPYHMLVSFGFNAPLFQNILFTCLQVSVATNAFWCYKLGIFHNNLYIEKQKPFVVGIAGDSGVGKSTFSERVKNLIGKNRIAILNGDDSHKWERGDEKWQLFTHLNPKANFIHKDVDQLYALVDGKIIERVSYNHKTGKFTRPSYVEKNKYIIFQGLHPFFLETMRNMYDLKIYIDAEEILKRKWKMERDMKYRGQSGSKIIKTIQKRKRDAAKFVAPQKKFADWLIYYYIKNNNLCVKYTFSNSLPVEELLKELQDIPQLKINHKYMNINLQTVTIAGKISKKEVADIAYKLYPNLDELLNNQPDFKEGNQGIHQLFFINYLNFFFIKNRPNSSSNI